MPANARPTNIVLNENLVQEAMKISKLKTKRAVIDLALREFLSDLEKEHELLKSAKISNKN